MATLSVAVPDTLKKKMTQMEEVNWSAVARHAFEQKVNQIEFLKSLAKKSTLSTKDSEEISTKISKGMAKKFMEM
ncbi:MAG: hypothetical protein QT08_C0020G0029 [archaeon GW2011_AR17]|nr:MAG: hypothetical protein QT08_C0020G0029 [archaeon GW2011_AR17]MBS3154050.1 hypothetical protein [Candidatus Woesearchaeota archaeon]HIH15560.1 hypothetical protein [Nanoarchaeota archaeon]HIH59108.1 hypothetical protein [Nanoarchaeota archaeon]HII14604.1 hypothetical protein [Nanoarchaeota archaeon]